MATPAIQENHYLSGISVISLEITLYLMGGINVRELLN